MFADDKKIYSCTISSNEDSILLQNDLNSIMRWYSTWLMDLNYDKCKCMSFGNHTLSMSQYLINVNWGGGYFCWESLQAVRIGSASYFRL